MSTCKRAFVELLLIKPRFVFAGEFFAAYVAVFDVELVE
jgi:hypothetical protein